MSAESDGAVGGGAAREVAAVEPGAATKRCPRCGCEIGVEQPFCHRCGQPFAVRRLGYCTTCHQRVEVDTGAACPTCGNDVVDVVVESEPLDAPLPTAATAPLASALPSLGAAEGQGPHEAAEPIPATRTPNWKRRVLVGTAITLLAGCLMIAASFMPWLGSEGGRTVTGMDLEELQRVAGKNTIFIPRFFTDASGDTWPFFTGMATLLAGLLVVGWALLILVATALLPNRKTLAFVMTLLLFPAVVVAFVVAYPQASSYVQGGLPSGASLEYGLILLWTAAFMAIFGLLYGVPRRS